MPGGVIVDIGTGNGKFAVELAKKNPERFIIGIDPSSEQLREYSLKITKKASKGDLGNALFVLGNVEDLPDELKEVANQVFINFPWSTLLKGLVLVEDNTWENIKKICQNGAYVDIILGYDITHDVAKVKDLGLPELSLDYLNQEMVPKLKRKGFEVKFVKEVTSEDIKFIPSSWAKKLAFGAERKYYYLRLKMVY